MAKDDREKYDVTVPKGEGETLVAWTERIAEDNNVEGLLIISPIGVGDQDAIEQIGIFTREEFAGRKSVAYLVAGIPGTPVYNVLDLNNLPEWMRIRIEITQNGVTQTSIWEGESGNMQQSTPDYGTPPPIEPVGPKEHDDPPQPSGETETVTGHVAAESAVKQKPKMRTATEVDPDLNF